MRLVEAIRHSNDGLAPAVVLLDGPDLDARDEELDDLLLRLEVEPCIDSAPDLHQQGLDRVQASLGALGGRELRLDSPELLGDRAVLRPFNSN